ncbi:GGDEF and EAL domain-containing protein [uncultured Ruminococcus sp.]|uniref:GGDEF and EAL domain-containing protein n=1 Tax=uncultured Ruminococcus sp. TaxID=165186 RepID=UPI0025D25485|nr:GGDEF and EAL domain-containing protein [uncultured Ruminococcus sp.]
MGKKMDKKNDLLENRLFDGFSDTSDRRYLYICDMSSNVTRWSRSAVEYFGFPGEYMDNAAGKWADHIHPDDRQRYEEDISQVFSGKKDRHDLDYRAMNKDGDYVICTCRGNVMRGSDGEPDIFIGTIENHGISDRVDAASGLYNVYEFLQYIRDLKSQGKTGLELLIGINCFSEVNDMYGHNFGDRVLKEVGRVLVNVLGGRSKVYRMDGVRFAFALTDTAVGYIYELYRKIQYEMKYNVFVDGIRIPVSISAGAVVLDGDYDEFSVQSSARYALEKSKHEQHGELYVFENNMKDTAKRRLELMSALRRSMLNDYEGFFMCYQPLFSSENEKLIGAEALLRWESRDFGTVMPGEFIPLLENDPSFFELGCWILRRALNESMMMVERDPDFTLNVNVSYTQLSHPLFRESVKAILKETGFPTRSLCMELTESCRQLEKTYLQAEIGFLKSLGIKIAIDDFGTGFSSLNLLSDLPVETLKFDRGFTKDIMTNTANQAIIKAISNCASELHVHVCLEGMESREMIEFVRQYCIYSFQGYYFSRPVVMGQFMQMYLKV